MFLPGNQKKLFQNLLPTQQKSLQAVELEGILKIGGVDGTRTRDPRRDRPVF
jgi:hypothetical protein